MKVRVLFPSAFDTDEEFVDLEAGAAEQMIAIGYAEKATKEMEKAAAAPPPEPEAEVEEEEAEEEDVEDVGDTGRGAYEDRTRLQLVQLARTKGIKGAAQMRKEDLIEALRG